MTSDHTASGEYFCVASRLVLRSNWDFIAFSRMAFRSRKQARSTAGNVVAETRGTPFKKDFYTLTVWKDRASMLTFRNAPPHTLAMDRMRQWAGDGSRFTEWTSTSPDITWDEAMQRLEKPTFTYSAPARR
jgi:hypothetical protein